MDRSAERLNANASDKVGTFLRALFNNFFVSGYYLDLKREKYIAIGQEETYSARYGTEDDWSRMDDYIRECINEEDRPLITEATRIPVIREHLKNEPQYSVEVRDCGTGSERWYRYTTMRGEDEDHAAICFTDVTEEVLRHRKAQALSEELTAQKEDLTRHLDALHSLSKLYFFSYYVDIDNDEYYELFADRNLREGYGGYETFGSKGRSQASLLWMCDNMIMPEYRGAMLEFVDYSTLSERMKDKEYVQILSRLVSGDWVRIRFIAGARHEDGTLKSCTFVVRNVNAEIAEEQKRNEELRDALKTAQDATAEQEAQIEEISSLNEQLEENQAELEAAAAEQEAQIEEITKLNLSLGEYNDALSNAGYGMWHIILKDGAAPRMRVNAKMAELLGVAGQTLTDEEMYDAWYGRIVPEAVPSVQASVSEMMSGRFSENTYLWNHPSKGLIYVRCGGTAKKAEDGADVLSGYHADVTDIVYKEQKHNAELEEARRRAEDERRRVSEAYGMIRGLSSEYHTIWVVNKDTAKMHLIRSSGKSTIRRAVQMGIDEPLFDPAFDTYINSCVEPEDRERMKREIAFAEVMRHLTENPDVIYAVNYLRRDDSGHVGYHQIAFANADTDDGVRQFVYGFRDIDVMVKEEQAQKEELRRARVAADAANDAKTTFLFNMSHDIRTPMNAIIGYTDLIEKHYDDKARSMEYLHKTQQSNRFLLSLINNVLEMARIESGKSQMEYTVSPVGGIARELSAIFEDQMRKKGIRYTGSVSTRSEYAFYDQAKVREIYLNILSNALKYTPAGGSVTMTVNELPSERPGYITMKAVFTDTGIGMSKEYLPHIFEEFSRERSTTESGQQGTGLGMPIVKKIIDLMGGTIEVESELGKGTTFTVTYPLKVEGALPDAPEAAPEEDAFDFTGKRVLLAEDNDLNAEIAIEILTEVGFTVDRAEDGLVCLNMLKEAKEGTYDVILMDVQMPNMNGYEAAEAIRLLDDPAKAGIPILAMTANAFEEDRREALKAGMNGHLAKPINVAELMNTLAETLK